MRVVGSTEEASVASRSIRNIPNKVYRTVRSSADARRTVTPTASNAPMVPMTMSVAPRPRENGAAAIPATIIAPAARADTA